MERKRSASVFSSTKLFIENSVGVTVDAVTLVRNELQHTARLNALENDIEYDETVVSALDDVLVAIAKLPATDKMSLSDTFKLSVLEKRLEKLKALV